MLFFAIFRKTVKLRMRLGKVVCSRGNRGTLDTYHLTTLLLGLKWPAFFVRQHTNGRFDRWIARDFILFIEIINYYITV